MRKNKKVSITMPIEIIKMVKKIAEDNHSSVSQVIRDMILKENKK